MKPATELRRPLVGDLLTVFPVALAVLAFFAWTVGSGAPERLTAPHQGDYYNLLVEGFCAGHLYMNADVAPALRLSPEGRPAEGAEYLLDASLHRGHYYLYFGLTPAVTIFLPFRLLTGLELNQLVVVALQGSAAFLAGLALLLVLRRHFAPAAGRLALLAAGMAWGFGSALPVTLRKPHMYEVAVTAGMVWSTAFLLFAVLAVLRPARAGRWLAWASLCAGLAAGSRPNLLVGTLALAGVLVWCGWRARRAGGLFRRRAVRWLAAAVGPAGAVGGVLLLYNYLRFGDPFEFGHRYQMGSSSAGFFSPRYFWHNLNLYYLTPPARSWLFPFFFPGAEGPRPPGYIGVEPLHGQFYCLVWIAMLAVVVTAARWRSPRDPERRMVAGVLAWWFGANLVLLACTSVRANRYLLDFHPALVLAGCGLLLEAATLPSRGLRGVVTGVGAAGVALMVVFNAAISVETMGRMRNINPVGYARLERASNRLVWPVFRLAAPHFGPRTFLVVFPQAAPSTFEPLLSAGPPLNGVSLLVHYLEPGRAELLLGDELTSDNPVGGSRGPEFETRPGQVHRLNVDLGWLLPPIGHPWFGAATEAAMQRRVTMVRVVLDGRDLLRVSERPHPDSPGQVAVGERRPWASAGPQFFSGTLREVPEVPRLPADLIPGPNAGWGYRIELRLPKDRFGSVEPLLTTGIRPTGDAVLLRYRDHGSVELIHDQIGGGVIGSVVVPLDYDQPQSFEAWFDPIPGTAGSPLYRLTVFHAGHPVMLERNPLQSFSYGQEAIGANVVASSAARASFAGTVLALTRADTADVSLRVMPEHDEGAAAVRFQLPPVPATLAQPLLVLSRSDGRQGLLAMRQSGATVQIGWHDSAGWWWSRSLGAPAAGDHTVGVRWSLGSGAAPAAGSASPGSLGAMIMADGMIFRHPRPGFFGAGVLQVAGWFNPWSGDPGTASHFEGSIESAPSLLSFPGAGIVAPPARHFLLAVRFPSDRPGRNEPLVTAGVAGSADGLYVHYEREGWVRIGFDHWGVGGPVSAAIPVVADAFELLDVEMGTGPWSRGGREAIRVALGGRPALQAPAEFFAVPPDQVQVGGNSAGLSTSDRRFSGEIYPVETMTGPR